MQTHVRNEVEIVIFTDQTSAWHKPNTDSTIVRLSELPGQPVTRPERMRNIRLFELHRETDASGVSGTGVVAEGACFSDGICAMRWLTATASTAVYDTPETLNAIHGHGGFTKMKLIKADGTVEDWPF